jgi:hypothetical protein
VGWPNVGDSNWGMVVGDTRGLGVLLGTGTRVGDGSCCWPGRFDVVSFTGTKITLYLEFSSVIYNGNKFNLTTGLVQ